MTGLEILIDKIKETDWLLLSKRILIFIMVLLLIRPWIPYKSSLPGKLGQLDDKLDASSAEARYQWMPSGGSVVVGSEFPVQNAFANVPSWRALASSDNYYWVTNFSATGLDKRAYVDGIQLKGANKIIVTYEGYVSDTSGQYFVQIYDNIAATWRNLNWIDTALTSGSDATYSYEIYNGYWKNGSGIAIDTPLSNFITNDSNNRIQVRIYSSVTGRSAIHYWDRLQVEVGVDPIYYAANGAVRQAGWNGAITNTYAHTTYADNSRYTLRNSAAAAMDFYIPFSNVQYYPGANSIFVAFQGYTSAAAMSYKLDIWNASTSDWIALSANGLVNTSELDYYFAESNISMDQYVENGTVKIRFYTATLNTNYLYIDRLYITIGSVNADTSQCQVSFGTQAGGTDCSNTRTLDTSSADSTWQQTTATTGSAGYYPGDYAGTWGTNQSASANLNVPISVPANAAVTAVKYAARFRSNSAAITAMPSLKDMSGLNPSLGSGYAITGGWTDIWTSNALVTYSVLEPLSYTYQTSPEDYINNFTGTANIRLRTSASTATGAITRDWDFAFVSIRYIGDDTVAASNPQFVAANGYVQTGSTVAVSNTNTASSSAMMGSDDYRWQNNNNASGLDVRININGVDLNNANKMIITYEGSVSNAALAYYVQIYDNASSTWRTLNDRETTLTSTSEYTYYFSIFNGFWTDGNTNTSTSTPLSNFITTDGFKTVQLRIYSTYGANTYIQNIDKIALDVASDPIYYAKGFFRTVGNGAITNTYKNTHPAATTGLTTGGSDNQRLAVANTAGQSFDFYLPFGNVQKYDSANAVMVYFEGYTSVAGLTYRPKIYNFVTNGGQWEYLTATNMANTSEANYQFAAAPVDLSNYISGGEIRIGFQAQTTTAGTFYIDYIYATLGSVAPDENHTLVTLGQTAAGSTYANTQSLDTTLASPDTWEIQTSPDETSDTFAMEWAGLIGVNQQATAQINMGTTVPANSAVTGVRYALRMLSTTSYLTWQGYLQDYSGITGAVGGWLLTGTANNNAATYTFAEGWQEATFRNAEDFVDTLNGHINIKLKPSANTLGDQMSPKWDFAFTSIRWLENSASSYYNYQFTPTGGTLADGGDLDYSDPVQNVGSYRGTFASDDQRWVVKNDPTQGLDARLSMDYVVISDQTNKLFVTYEGQVSAAAGTFYLQVYDYVNSTWRTITDREAAIAPTSESTIYTYEIYNGRWQSAGTPIDTPLSNFFSPDDIKTIQFRIYSTVLSQSFVVQTDRLQLEIGADSLYYPANFARTAGNGAITNNYSYTFSSDNNRQAVANTAGQSAAFEYTFKNIKLYDGANSILVRYEGYTSTAGLTYKLRIWNYALEDWENITGTALANTSDALNSFSVGPVTLNDNYVSSGEIKIGIAAQTTTAGTLYCDLIYLLVGSVVDTATYATNSEITFGTQAVSTDPTLTQSVDTSLALNSEQYWGITSALTSAKAYPGDWAGTYGTNDNAAAWLNFPVAAPAGSKVTSVRYAVNYLSGHANNSIEYAIRDYAGTLGTIGGYIDPGNSGVTNNSATAYTFSMYRYTNNPEDFVDFASSTVNMKIRTTASGDTSLATARWDFAFVSISWRMDENHSSWSHQLTPNDGEIIEGDTVAQTTNDYPSWRAVMATDNGRQAVQNTGSGLDYRFYIDGVDVSGANKLIITYEGYTSNAALTYYVQIYDYVNATWRTLNDREAALTSATEASYYFSLFNGFFTSSTANGGDPLDTPLSNFVSSDATQRLQIRIYSTYTAGTQTHYTDRIQLEIGVDPIYWASDFARTAGNGAITNSYKQVHPAATLAVSTGGSDDQRLTVVNTAGQSFDLYFDFNNVVPYTGTNAILLYFEGSTSAAAMTYRPKIYNFVANGGQWEDLTTTAMNNTTEAAYQFAKAPITITDYISDGKIRIGFYTPTTAAGTFLVDYLYVTIGTVISDDSDLEQSLGTGVGSIYNTQDLDTTLANPNEYGIATSLTGTAPYPYDYPANLYGLSMAGAANITFRTTVPNGAFTSAFRYAARFRSNSTLMTVQGNIFDYSGVTGLVGGWLAVGATNALTTYTFSEAFHHATYNNTEDFTANYQKKNNLRLRTTASTLSDQTTIGWDFAFISMRFAGTSQLSQNYYRWYANANDITPSDPWPAGAADLGENTAITNSDSPPDIGAVLRLRMSINIHDQDLSAATKSFKLQYATSTNCFTVPWDLWEDVSDISSCGATDPWCGYNNSTPAGGSEIISRLLSVSDVNGTYQEENPSLVNPNAATAGQDIEYDWVLKNNNASSTGSYCFRMAESDDTPLFTYLNYPKLITPLASSLSMSIDTNSIAFPSLSPGTPSSTSSKIFVSTSNSTGYNISAKKDNADNTLKMATNPTFVISDKTAWSAPVSTTTTGNSDIFSGDGLAARIMQAGTDLANYADVWWGADDDPSNALFAGFNSADQCIVNRSVSSAQDTTTIIEYKLNVPWEQKEGGYSGTITYTVVANP